MGFKIGDEVRVLANCSYQGRRGIIYNIGVSTYTVEFRDSLSTSLLGFNEHELEPWEEPTIILKSGCTCGASITYGRDCIDDFHAHWCDSRAKKKLPKGAS